MKDKIENKSNRNEVLENILSKIRKVKSNENLDSRIKIQLHDIEADLEKMKAIEKTENPYKKILIRFSKILMFIFIIKFIRRYIRTNETMANELQHLFISVDEEQFILSLVFLAIVTAVSILIFYLAFNWGKKDIIQSPVVLSLVTFIFIDVALILVFPEVTISVFKTYLFG